MHDVGCLLQQQLLGFIELQCIWVTCKLGAGTSILIPGLTHLAFAMARVQYCTSTGVPVRAPPRTCISFIVGR